MGFCVAMTMKGAGRARVVPSTETVCSSMDSRSADWVLGGVRLISSARSRFVNTGPSRKTNSDRPASQIIEPVMSAGIRSGVNWIRAMSTLRAWASARTRSVLATPGTPSSKA